MDDQKTTAEPKQNGIDNSSANLESTGSSGGCACVEECRTDQPDLGPSDETKSDHNPEQLSDSKGPSRDELITTIQKLREEAKAARDRMMRIAADADNMRKRGLKERKEVEKYSQENLLRDLLTPLDNLERTLEHIPDDQNGSVVSSLKQGLEMVLQQFYSTLSTYNLIRLETTEGEPFEPTQHEALHRTETLELPPGTIVKVLQQGYMLHDRLLRPALVDVACTTSQTQSSDAPICTESKLDAPDQTFDDSAEQSSGDEDEIE